MDVDAKSQYSKKITHNVNSSQEKKKKHLEACMEQHRNFYPFMVSTDGLLVLSALGCHELALVVG
jgi:hypothetical protein